MIILILNPIEKEHNAVKSQLRDFTEHMEDGLYYVSGSFKGLYQDFQIYSVLTEARNTKIALAAEKSIRRFKPDFIFLIGIAAGVKDVEIGDIVVATHSYSYESGKIKNGKYEGRPVVFNFTSELRALARWVKNDNSWMARRIKENRKSNIEFGPVISGDRVLDSDDAQEFDIITNHYSDTLALEMEAHGFGEALKHHPQVLSLLIRGISDKGVNKSNSDKKGGQERAVANVSAFTFELIYQLNPNNLETIKTMNEQVLSRTLFEKAWPLMKEEEDRLEPFEKSLLEKLKLADSEAYQSLIQNYEDKPMQGFFTISLERSLKANQELKKELESLLKQMEKETPATTHNTVINSKNVIQGIKSKGNIQVGDNTININNK